MSRKTSTVNLTASFNTDTRELTINTDGTPPEVFEVITMIQAQLVPVFSSLDTQLRNERDKTSLIIPQPNINKALGLKH